MRYQVSSIQPLRAQIEPISAWWANSSTLISTLKAARRQELTPDLGADILVSAEMARMVGDAIGLRSLGEVEVRGRAAPVEVYTTDVLPAIAGVIDVGISGDA